MALKGNLRDFTATQILNLINLARKSGTLTVQGAHTAEISFREGKLIYAELDVQQGNLTQILHRAGKLTAQQAQLIDERLKNSTDKQLGHRLIQSKLVTQNDIIQSIRQHVLDVVYKIFTWAEGSFLFDAARQPYASRITIPIDLEIVIVEGSRRLQESKQLQEELPDMNARLKFVQRPESSLRKVNLTVEEWRIVSQINAQNTLQEIANAHNLTDFQIRRTVYGMMQAGIVQLVEVPKAAPQKQETRREGRGRRPEQSVAERKNVVNRLIDRIRKL